MNLRFERSTNKCTVLIFLCFLLTSTGWLAWSYRLKEHMAAGMTDVMIMVIGYFLQAVGIGVFSAIIRFRKDYAKTVFFSALCTHLLFMVPAVVSSYTAGILAFGFLMNIVCGVIAGYYLYYLTENAGKEKRAAVFGTGYALSILASWILSLFDRVYYSAKILIVCAVLTAAAAALICVRGDAGDPVETLSAINDGSSLTAFHKRVTGADRNFISAAVIIVIIFSMVNSSGFAFSAADVGSVVNVELSRLVYAVGLIIAGIVTDRSRKYGAVAALTALIIPFIILALRREPLPAVMFWALGYFVFGFYAVFRVILFSDIASEGNLPFMSGFGLMFGRIGDALGEGICLALSEHIAVQVCLTAVLFVAAVAVFFRAYGIRYAPVINSAPDEKAVFNEFSVQHDLSAREKDVLRLLLEEKTNSEIAALLFISENTVKFHVRNILQKTGCANRKEIQNVYRSLTYPKTTP